MMVVLAAIVLMLLIKAFVVQVYRIPSSSMEDTLLTGDRVLVNKLVYHVRGIARGDIVVFSGDGSWGSTTGAPDPSPPGNPLLRAGYDVLADIGVYSTQTYYIKRVIGLPGDHVVCCVNGEVTVNGVPLDETSYLFPGASPSIQPFSVIVPPGRLWVMGDNRAISDDSRGHMSSFPAMGTVPENEVAGRAFMVIWPPSQIGDLPIPATFQQAALHAGQLERSCSRSPGQRPRRRRLSRRPGQRRCSASRSWCCGRGGHGGSGPSGRDRVVKRAASDGVPRGFGGVAAARPGWSSGRSRGTSVTARSFRAGEVSESFVTVTLPFHRLAGQRLRVLGHQRSARGLELDCDGGDLGRVRLPATWTDRVPAGGRGAGQRRGAGGSGRGDDGYLVAARRVSSLTPAVSSRDGLVLWIHTRMICPGSARPSCGPGARR